MIPSILFNHSGLQFKYTDCSIIVIGKEAGDTISAKPSEKVASSRQDVYAGKIGFSFPVCLVYNIACFPFSGDLFIIHTNRGMF